MQVVPWSKAVRVAVRTERFRCAIEGTDAAWSCGHSQSAASSRSRDRFAMPRVELCAVGRSPAILCLTGSWQWSEPSTCLPTLDLRRPRLFLSDDDTLGPSPYGRIGSGPGPLRDWSCCEGTRAGRLSVRRRSSRVGSSTSPRARPRAPGVCASGSPRVGLGGFTLCADSPALDSDLPMPSMGSRRSPRTAVLQSRLQRRYWGVSGGRTFRTDARYGLTESDQAALPRISRAHRRGDASRPEKSLVNAGSCWAAWLLLASRSRVGPEKALLMSLLLGGASRRSLARSRNFRLIPALIDLTDRSFRGCPGRGRPSPQSNWTGSSTTCAPGRALRALSGACRRRLAAAPSRSP